MEQRITDVLNRVKPGVDFSTLDNILEKGVFSSLEFFTFVIELAEEFGVEIEAEQIVPENFVSIATISNMLKELIEGKTND